MDRLEPPAVLDERRRQPVEQFGMAGAVALGAEVVDRLHQPGAEVVLPEPVDDHPGRQRMLGRGQPAGQPGARVGHVGGQLGQVVGTSTLGGRGPTGSPLFSQTPRFRTWIGVRCCESFQMAGIVGRRRRASSLRAPRSPCSAALAPAPGARLRPGFLTCAISVLTDLRLRLPGFPLRRRGEDDVVLLGRREVRLEPVVVLLRDRLELVVVAAGTADGQPEERRADDVGALGQDLVAAQGDLGVAGVPPDRAEPVERSTPPGIRGRPARSRRRRSARRRSGRTACRGSRSR